MQKDTSKPAWMQDSKEDMSPEEQQFFAVDGFHIRYDDEGVAITDLAKACAKSTSYLRAKVRDAGFKRCSYCLPTGRPGRPDGLYPKQAMMDILSHGATLGWRHAGRIHDILLEQVSA